ncbi:MAG: hypothetical protein O2890_14360 [Cyanobacteria bacterium]|nr:hypothetical protein [Cyanobacteriota bacterium]MDA0867559.1 hypothetical protein [Cyanobacteriota bacterium]
MFGTFQDSAIRIEVAVAAPDIQKSLVQPQQVRQWLWPQTLSPGLPEFLEPGLSFTSHLGAIALHHHVDQVSDHRLRLLVAGAIDGFHEWQWGNGWVQSRLEGISMLPINLAHTAQLWRLQQFLSGLKSNGGPDAARASIWSGFDHEH